MSDEDLMMEREMARSPGPPYLVKAAIGKTSIRKPGGAVTHTELSGIADYKFKTEQEAWTSQEDHEPAGMAVGKDSPGTPVAPVRMSRAGRHSSQTSSKALTTCWRSSNRNRG